MAVLFLILLLLAAVCFAAAAVIRRDPLALGLFFWVLVALVSAVQALLT